MAPPAGSDAAAVARGIDLFLVSISFTQRAGVNSCLIRRREMRVRARLLGRANESDDGEQNRRRRDDFGVQATIWATHYRYLS